MDGDAQPEEIPHILDIFLGVPRKAGYGFDKDTVDFSVPAILYHAVEIIPLACHKAGDALVGVNVRQLPALMGGNVFGVVVHLCDVGVLLVVRVAAHTGICRHAEFCDFLLFR
ncbi:hypothetical protein SDC9_122040 [bioreactor metagenome]|uniref:Uncharacterized protein n=1 Tax=bioreactor metagenome TaxID=1076179 RepID=A0A645CDN5_9ZZZZ